MRRPTRRGSTCHSPASASGSRSGVSIGLGAPAPAGRGPAVSGTSGVSVTFAPLTSGMRVLSEERDSLRLRYPASVSHGARTGLALISHENSAARESLPYLGRKALH